MKNKMKRIIKLSIFIFLSFLVFHKELISKEFNFEGEEIQILNDGNLLVSRQGVKIETEDNLKITADEFEYDKKKLELLLKGNILVEEANQGIEIEADKVIYFKDREEIKTYGKTEVRIENEYLINSKDVNLSRIKGTVSSLEKTIIDDKYSNKFKSTEFVYFINEKLIKAKKVEIIDNQGNISKLNNFFGALNNNEYFGKDVKIDFNKNTFGNSENEPRLYGNTISSNENISKISKGVFTTCKRREKCPPWKISAGEVVHDKNKKIINYKDAWLSIYDKPVIYFPKFFHPDPTVKRQSGFLVPAISDSGNTGTSLLTPYFKVIDVNKDLTFKPRFFANSNLLLQNEYRQVEKNLNHIMDFAFFTSSFNNNEEASKSHFFSNSIIKYENKYFENTNLEINLEQVSNDTYLKKFKPRSELIKSDNLMHSFLSFEGNNDTSALDITLESYEDLTKVSSDRYEFIYPNIQFTKDLFPPEMSSSLSLKTSLYQRQYETNKYEQSLITDLLYSTDTKFNLNGVTRDFHLLFKNPNIRNKTGSNNQSNNENKLLTKLMYSLSYPLKKQGQIYDGFLKPNLSLRFSPNNTRNISNEDRRLETNSINSFNRLSMINGVEGGQSLTAGLNYQLKNKIGEEKISFDLNQVIRDKANPDLPTSSTLNNKYSDIIGKVKFNLFDNLNFEYDFMLDNNLDKTNYNYIETNLTVNNLITSFQYLEEDGEVGSRSYLKNQTKYSFDENNSVSFATRRNRELDITEFYNLIYQYENDCLKAAIEYNKTFYNDTDISPEEELLLTLTIVPFTKLSTTNISE